MATDVNNMQINGGRFHFGTTVNKPVGTYVMSQIWPRILVHWFDEIQSEILKYVKFTAVIQIQNIILLLIEWSSVQDYK